ncbi:Ribosomal protein S18 acetylase RimI [Kaistella jeonii]|nr:Ribosomal protein S18 acetylase RimI [Kaistella jeonii]VEI97116.1 putative acetyltransferase [Kaistella jeonii]
MVPNFKIEKATEKDHLTLTEITVDGKAFWGFSKEELSKWKNELTITPEYIAENETYNLVLDSSIVGYYSFLKIDENTLLLDNLFLFQKVIGKGFGKLLMQNFLKRAKSLNISNIILEAEPNAENFYKKFGFSTYDHRESVIKGRFLPKMKLDLT